MKTTNLLVKLALCIVLYTISTSVFATPGGSIMGIVTDPETKLPVSDATVILENQGVQHLFYTNENGYYYAGNIPAGVYNITVSYMSSVATISGVKIGNEEVKDLPISFSSAIQMPDIEYTEFKRPIIDPYHIDETFIDRETFKNMPLINVSQLNETVAGTIKINGEEYVHGARAGSISYYIDGMRVMGNPNIPLCGLDSYRNLTGFVPAKYGDSTGGVIVMETRNFFSEQ